LSFEGLTPNVFSNGKRKVKEFNYVSRAVISARDFLSREEGDENQPNETELQ